MSRRYALDVTALLLSSSAHSVGATEREHTRGLDAFVALPIASGRASRESARWPAQRPRMCRPRRQARRPAACALGAPAVF
jgi:hypothetical protein